MADKINDLTKAIALAARVHVGQWYSDGEPYILHPLRVMAMMPTDDLIARIVAVLHDTLEDTPPRVRPMLEGEILQTFTSDVYMALWHLTRMKDKETYAEYIVRVNESELARRVKIADLTDNILHNPPESLAKRYSTALDVLIKDL